MVTTMRVLAATHLLPYPPDSGGKIVSAQTLACLERHATLDVCTFDPPWRHADGASQLRNTSDRSTILPLKRRGLCWWPLMSLRGRPYFVFRDDSVVMRKQFAAWAQDGPDVLLADSLHMAHYVSACSLPKILMEHNVESYLVGEYLRRHRNPVVRLLGRVEWGLLERYEREACNEFDVVIVLSEDDRERLLRLGVRSRIAVLPPAVDPVEPVPEGLERRHVVHIGTGHWPPVAEGLRWYVHSVHPLVRAKNPGSEVWLAGARPLFLRRGPVPDGIQVLDYVPDLEPIYRGAAVFIVPVLVGGGVRLKILHALARGLAVVSTTPGCEGLGLEGGRHLLVADDPRRFADAVLAVLSDGELRRRLGAAGREHVLSHFNPEARCAVLHGLLREVAGRAGA